MLWVGWPILRKFWFSLVHRALNMYTLIGLGDGGAHVVLFSGQPLREPIVPYGPFVGNSRQDIAAYAVAFQSGAMGTLEPSFSR